MHATIGIKELRLHLSSVVRSVSKGKRFTILYRNHPAFDIVPVGGEAAVAGSFEDDSLYKAEPLGRSTDGRAAGTHDAILYS